MAGAIRVFVSLALVLFALSGCGGSGGSNDIATPPATDTNLDWDQGNWDEEDWG